MPRKGRVREKDTQAGYELQEGRDIPSGFVPYGYESRPRALHSRATNEGEVNDSLLTQVIRSDRSQSFSDPDEALEHIFREQIEHDTTQDGSQIVVSVLDGVLHLTGLALSEESREAIGQMASSLKGVKRVENHLQIRSIASQRYRAANSQSTGLRGVRASIGNARRRQ